MYRVGIYGGGEIGGRGLFMRRPLGRGCLWGTFWFIAGGTLSRSLEHSQIIPLWKLQKKM